MEIEIVKLIEFDGKDMNREGRGWYWTHDSKLKTDER